MILNLYNLRKLLFLLGFFTITAHAKIEDHFKKCPNKGTHHNIRNVDFIYIINLDKRPEKLENSLAQLEPWGIFPYRFSAVNGWELTLEDINDVGVIFEPGMEGSGMGTSYLPGGNFEPHHEIIRNYGQTYFCHCCSRGAIGICLSHLSILQDAYDSGYETIWVMEDDIEVLRNPLILSDLIDRLDARVGKEGWDILFTDEDIRDENGHHKPMWGAAWRPNFKAHNPGQYAVREYLGYEFCRIGSRWGATSMIYRRSGMEKILNFLKKHKLFLPYDLEFILPDGIRLYTVLNDVVSNLPKASSDNGSPNYLQK